MNKVILMGRFTRDPEVRYTQGQEQTCIARFTIAVDRRKKDSGADFISCVAFGKTAEFCEHYARKGMKFVIEGRIQTGSYEKDGKKVYTTDVVVDQVEFAESKNSESQSSSQPQPQPDSDGFMSIPDGIEEELPFV